MSTIDWNEGRISPSDLELLDSLPRASGSTSREVRRYRQRRVREEMEAHGVDAVILSDAVNIRYATGTRNMQIFSSRNAPSRYLLLTEDRSILFEFTGCEHLADGYDTVDEVRPSTTASFCAAGPDIAGREVAWANSMAQLIGDLVGPHATVGIERMNAGSAIALASTGLQRRRRTTSCRASALDQVRRRAQVHQGVVARHRSRRRQAARCNQARHDRSRTLVDHVPVRDRTER